MKRITIYIVSLVGLVIMVSIVLVGSTSRSSVESPQELMAWVHDAENGVSKHKSVQGVELTMTYMPPEYLAYREMKNQGRYTQSLWDSLRVMYSHSQAFQLKVAPDGRMLEGDIMYKDVYNYNDYEARVKQMNFGMEQLLELKVGSASMVPSLALMENMYSLTDDRKILLLFTPEDRMDVFDTDDDTPIDLVYYDEVFNTGIHHFIFTAEDLESIPELKFTQTMQ